MGGIAAWPGMSARRRQELRVSARDLGTGAELPVHRI